MGRNISRSTTKSTKRKGTVARNHCNAQGRMYGRSWRDLTVICSFSTQKLQQKVPDSLKYISVSVVINSTAMMNFFPEKRN